MKTCRLALSIFMLCSAFSLFGSEKDLEEKFYCSPEQIVVSEQCIYIKNGEELLEVDQLEVDQGGIFFTFNHARIPATRRPINPKNICQFLG